MIHTIGLDADDTLWHNENQFADMQLRMRELLAPWATTVDLETELSKVEKANLTKYGYGVKSFILSMVEFACSLSDHQISPVDIRKIIDWGHEMLDTPVEFLDGVEDTVQQLAQQYRVVIMTKGDLYHQEGKIKASGLLNFVNDYSVMAFKDEPSYQREMASHNIDVSGFLMVGNSVPSDVLPVVAIGGHAAHIPYHLTWEHEVHSTASGHTHGYHELENISEVPDLAASL